VNDAALAARWYAAWNAADLERILALYAEDVEFSSPYITTLGHGASGVIRGKQDLRDYFAAGLARNVELRFEPEALCVGARGHTLIYRNHRGERVAECHEYGSDGLIRRADATYEAAH
jgi:ketosteroid isomerase-like protein